MSQDILDALRAVVDPDLHQDIVSLGFVHDVRREGGVVSFEVRLTTPACPAREQLRAEAEAAVRALPGVERVEVRMTSATRGFLGAGAPPSLAGVRNLVVVASGKGGVGKSTVAANLAWALAATGARVGLLDADVQGPSVQHLTGAGVPEELGEGGLGRPPEVDGVAVLSMAMFVTRAQPALLRGPRVTAVVQQLLTGFDWGARDYLLVDSPPGTGDIHLTLAQIAPFTGVVLVTTPQETAVLDARRAATMYRQLSVPVLGVIETMSGFHCPSCDTLHPIFGEGGGERLANELGVPLLGRIPLDPAVVAGGERARPVVVGEPDAPAAAAFREAAGRLAAALSVRHAESGAVLDHFELVWRRDGR